MAISIINTLVLAITAWIVWEYTKAAQQSNEIQERPVLNLKAIQDRVGTNSITYFKVKNIGKGPAYNIAISTIRTEGGYVYGPYLKEDTNSMLEVGDEEEIKFWVHTPTGGTEVYERVLGFQFFARRLFALRENRATEQVRKTSAIFIVHYEGLGNRKYYALFRFYPTLELVLDNDIFLEFVASGRGSINREEAVRVCESKALIQHIGQRVRDHR